MNDFAYFNHNGIWFRVHGDPGTDEARKLMRMAVSDLSLSKTQNVNDLEIVDVNRFPFYHVKSHFGKDTIELWPERYAEEKRERIEYIQKTPRKEIKVSYAFAYEVCDRDFIDGGTQNEITGDIPVPVGYAICQPGSLKGWELFETDNVIPMHFMSNYNTRDNVAGDWKRWVSSYRNSNPMSTVYPFMYPDWKLQAENTVRYPYSVGYRPVGDINTWNPYPDDVVLSSIIPDILMRTEQTMSDNGALITRSTYDVSQPLEMQEAVFSGYPIYNEIDDHWLNDQALMTMPGKHVENWIDDSVLGYLKFEGDARQATMPRWRFGPHYHEGTYFSLDSGPCCAKDLNKYVQFCITSNGGIVSEWLQICGIKIKYYKIHPVGPYNAVMGWNYRWFDISQNSAIIPFIRMEGNTSVAYNKIIAELWQYSNGEIQILDEITFPNIGLTGNYYDWTWDKTWFELTNENGETLRLSNGNTARCWGAFRMFKIVEEVEYKDKIEITEGEI